MDSPALLLLMLAFLEGTAGTRQHYAPIDINKCCDIHQILSADGKSCVEVPWPQNISLITEGNGVVRSPLNNEWVRVWLPPGLPTQSIRSVYSKRLLKIGTVVSVNASSFWDPALLRNEDLWRKTVAFIGGDGITRPKPGGGFRSAVYCVDAAMAPLGPHVMRVRTACTENECAFKCCGEGQLLQNKEGSWSCEWNAEDNWTPYKSNLTQVLDPEFPYHPYFRCEPLRPLPFDIQRVKWGPHGIGNRQFRLSSWDTCFDFHRSNGSIVEGVFVCEIKRVTRGVYWLLRPLCILSALLLLVALVSIACDKNMRRKIHGRCLAGHAACLLAFNIGQIVYYIANRDVLDVKIKFNASPERSSTCKYVALSMYFLLTGAWCWLTVLCVNMAMGFRLQVTRPNKESKKRFFALSTFAWGLPALLTITCSFLIAHEADNRDIRWYNPSLVETRVCYTDYIIRKSLHSRKGVSMQFHTLKTGTALFYFGPMWCLVVGNVICLSLTLKKVQYLKRGNSVLRREEDHIPQGQRHTEGNDPSTAHTTTGDGKRNRSNSIVEVKTIKLYIKMILMTGGIEMLCEFIMWSTTIYKFELTEAYANDFNLAYRAAGYVMDFFRAAVVTWLAAPEGGYLGLILRMLRRDKKSSRTGNAGRRKQDVA